MSKKVEQSVEILSRVSEGAHEALKSHLVAQGVGADALKLLDGLVLMVRAEYVLKHRERHWSSVAGEVAKELPVVLAGAKRLGGVEIFPDLSAVLSA